jgi:molybdopterin synthase catalytic subunit
VAEPRLVVGVVDRPISASELVEMVGSSEDGAVVCFEGRVRTRNRGRVVVRLHYEAYPGMADETLREIAAEAARKHAAGSVAAFHRTGTLDIGEVSVAIAASAMHRSNAFDAVRHVIEQVKVRLPVWKREEYADGSSEWLDGVTPDAGAGVSE